MYFFIFLLHKLNINFMLLCFNPKSTDKSAYLAGPRIIEKQIADTAGVVVDFCRLRQ